MNAMISQYRGYIDIAIISAEVNYNEVHNPLDA